MFQNILFDFLATVAGVLIGAAVIYYGKKAVKGVINFISRRINKSDLDMDGGDPPDDLDLSSDDDEEYGEDDKPDKQINDINYLIKDVDEHVDEYAKLIRDCARDCVEAEEEAGARERSWIQKAAIFLITVGADISSRIFSYLFENDIDTVTFEIARTGSVSHITKLNAMQEFKRLKTAVGLVSFGGVDFARELLEKSLGKQYAIETLNRLSSSLQVRPFSFVRKTIPSHLLNLIKQEHPQVIALVLSYLEPNKASVILENLPSEIQSNVVKRIANMRIVSPVILREIERVLEKKLSSLSSEDYTAAGGVESVVEILNLTKRETEKQVIEELDKKASELAEEIKKRMFVFEDVVMLDDRAIQKVMREIDSQELAKSLKSVDSEVQAKFFNNMSKRAASMLKEDMEYMGPIRLKDVEEAQLKIVSIIRHLEECGEIVIARAGEDELVV